MGFVSEYRFKKVRALEVGLVWGLMCLVLAVSTAHKASANSYTVYTCNHAADQGYGYVDNLFTYSTDDSSRTEEINDCDGSVSGIAGIGVKSRLGSTAADVSGVQTFSVASSGLRVGSVDVDYEVYKLLEEDWYPFLMAGSSEVASCDYDPFTETDCTDSGSYSASGLSLSSFAVGFECLDATFGCSVGSGSHRVYSTVYGASFGLFESPVVAPVVGVGSSGFGGSGPFNGSETVSVDASDARGVKQASVVVDGVEVVSGSFVSGCDFTVAAQPCENLSGEELTVDTSTLSDGSHTVYVSALDAAGNEGTSDSWTVTTDNTAPISPSRLNITADSSGAVSASWGLPSGQVSGISKAFFKVCDPNGSCTAYTQADTTTSLSTTVSNPVAGDYTLYVYLQDAAGNSDTTFPAIKSFNFIGTVTDNTTTTPTVTDTTTTVPTTTTDTVATRLKITSSKRYRYKKRWLIKTKGTCTNIATGTKVYLTHTPKYKKKLRSKYRIKKTGKCLNQKFTIKTKLSRKTPYKKFKTFKTKATTKTPKHTTNKTTKTSKKRKTKRSR